MGSPLVDTHRAEKLEVSERVGMRMYVLLRMEEMLNFDVSEGEKKEKKKKKEVIFQE